MNRNNNNTIKQISFINIKKASKCPIIQRHCISIAFQNMNIVILTCLLLVNV